MDNNNEMEKLDLIKIADGAYCRINKIVCDVDIVDIEGVPLEKNGVRQAQNSQIELIGDELSALVLPVQIMADKVFKVNC